MALKNENKVNKPLYVQDSSKIYGKVEEEEKIRKLLIDMKEQQKQLQNQVNSQITSRHQNGRVSNVYDRLSKQINVVKTSRNIGDQSSIQHRKLDDSTMQINSMMNDLSKLNPTNEKLNMNYQSLETSSLDYSQLKPQNHNVSQFTLKDLSHLALQQDDSNILRLKREMIAQAVKQYSTKPQKQALSNLQSPDNQSTLFNSQNQIKHFNKLKEIKMNLKHVINISARQSNQLSQIQDSSLLGANKQTFQNNSSVMANQQSQILPNQLQTEAYHKINEYLEHLKTQQETSEQPNIKIVEIIKAFMHEMIQAYTEESIKTEKSQMQQQIEQNIELLKGLINSPRKMKKKQLELLMKQISEAIEQQTKKDASFVSEQPLISQSRHKKTLSMDIKDKKTTQDSVVHEQEKSQQQEVKINQTNKKQFITDYVEKTLNDLQDITNKNHDNIVEQLEKDYYYFKDSKEFFEAVKMNDVIKVLRFMKQDKKYANDLDNLQRTPLMWAVKRGYDKMVGILLDYGANITIKDSFGRSAIDLAEKKDNKEITQILKRVEHGKYGRSTEKYQSAIYIKSLLPYSRMDEFNKFLGNPSIINQQLDFLFQ
eukprot:403343404